MAGWNRFVELLCGAIQNNILARSPRSSPKTSDPEESEYTSVYVYFSITLLFSNTTIFCTAEDIIFSSGYLYPGEPQPSPLKQKLVHLINTYNII